MDCVSIGLIMSREVYNKFVFLEKCINLIGAVNDLSIETKLKAMDENFLLEERNEEAREKLTAFLETVREVGLTRESNLPFVEKIFGFADLAREFVKIREERNETYPVLSDMNVDVVIEFLTGEKVDIEKERLIGFLRECRMVIGRKMPNLLRDGLG